MKTRHLFLIVVASVLVLALVSSATALTVSVAASDSSATSKSQANYVCTGTNDQTQITNALNAVAASGGGTVHLSEGTFTVNWLTIPANVVLQGKGSATTFLQSPSSGSIDLPNPGSKLGGVKISGKSMVYITASHVTVQDVTITSRGMRWCSFGVETLSSTNPVEDVEFRDCKVIDSDNIGYWISATSYGWYVKNLRFINCQAINCGATAQFNPWVVGFDLAEMASVDGMLVENCYASGNYESGFHFEGQPVVRNAVLRNCVSENNGLSPTAIWGAGYVLGEGTVVENCVSRNNKDGFFVHSNGVAIKQCTDTSSERSFFLEYHTGGHTLTDVGSKGATINALSALDQTNTVVTNLIVENCLGSTPVLVPRGINSVFDWRYGSISSIGAGTVPTTAPTTAPTTTVPTTVRTTVPTTVQTTVPTTAPTTVPTTVRTTVPTTTATQTAEIRFTSSPPGGQIYIDNVYKGLTPATISGITLGAHRFEIRLPGYQTWGKTVQVTSSFVGVFNSYNPVLVKITPTTATPTPTPTTTASTNTASIRFTSTPSNGQIYIDNVYKGLTPATIPGVALGRHRFEIRLSGYQTWGKTVQVTSSFLNRFNSYNPVLVKN